MHVGRLRVVEEPHAIGFRDRLTAMTLGREARQPVADRRGFHAERECGRGSRRGIGAVSRPLPVDPTELLRRVQHRDQGAVTVANLVRPRIVRTEPDDPARRLRRHARREDVVATADVHVADGRLPRVDATLGAHVRLERPMPIEVVGREVEQDRDARVQGLLVGELEGRCLDDERVMLLEGRGRERHADVAARDGVQPAGAQTRRDHARRRRLPVRSGHGEVRDADEPGPELQLTPDRDVALVRP